MYCTQCGVQHEDAARFCSQCGKPTAPGTGDAAYARASYASTGYVPTGGPYRPLLRVRDGAWLGGVCAGLAKYWDMDPALVRILFVALALCPLLPAIIPYIVCWIIMPREPLPSAAPSNYMSPGSAVSAS